ncbi:MAG: aromatic ring-hydroxylating dioxygenase subunit alpha [Gemmatimonadota bacterium]
MDQLHVDPDIRRAETPHARLYHDPAWFELARERIFARSWQLVDVAGRLKAPGHVRPLTLLPGCLDEPLVLTRDEDGALHCLSNVCTHRAALVVEGEGHLKTLRCRYHGRRFHLDGRLHSMPEFEGVEGFPSERDDLPSVELERWGPLLFGRLGPAAAFDDWIGPVRERTDWLEPQRLRFDPDTSRDYLIEANWALYCDNYLEEFHIPYVHRDSLGGLDYDRYRTECFDLGNLQFGIARPGETAFDLPEGHPDHGERIGAWYFWLWPNLMLNFYPWGLSANVVQPLGPRRTRVSYLSFVMDEGLRHVGVGAGLHRVEMEDQEVVESVQQGVRSRLYDRGRYSPRREVGTHHFHTLLARSMNEPRSPRGGGRGPED